MATNLGDLRVNIGADTTGLDEALKKFDQLAQRAERVQTSFNAFATGSQRADRATKKAASSTDQAQRALRQLDSSLGGARRASAQLSRAQERLDKAFDAGIISAKQYNARVQEMQQRFSTAEVKSRDLRDNLRSLAGGIGRATGSFRQLARTMGPLIGVGAAAGFGALIAQSVKAAGNRASCRIRETR